MVRRLVAYLILAPLLGALVSAPAHAVQCVCDASKNGATTMANKVLQHAEVIQIFWGTGWSTINPSAKQISAAVLDYMDGPSLARLNEYGAAGQGSGGRVKSTRLETRTAYAARSEAIS